MDEYTYDNIVIDPTKEGIESLIGREVYFHDNPSLCLKNANDKSPVMSGILAEICRVSINPFLIKKDDGIVHAYPCIIEKKEDTKPEYTPFKSKEEFSERYNIARGRIRPNSLKNNFLKYGMWLKERGTESDTYCLMTDIEKEGIDVGDKKVVIEESTTLNKFIPWQELYTRYAFLDGSPCGRLKEGE